MRLDALSSAGTVPATANTPAPRTSGTHSAASSVNTAALALANQAIENAIRNGKAMDISAALAEHGAQADAQTLALGERRASQRAFAGTRQVGTQSLAQVLAGVAAQGARACAEAGRNTKGMLAHARRRSQRCKAYGAGRWVVAAAQARTALQAALQGQEGSLMLLDDAIAAARLSSLDSAMLQQLLNAREHLQVLRFACSRSQRLLHPPLRS